MLRTTIHIISRPTKYLILIPNYNNSRRISIVDKYLLSIDVVTAKRRKIPNSIAGRSGCAVGRSCGRYAVPVLIECGFNSPRFPYVILRWVSWVWYM